MTNQKGCYWCATFKTCDFIYEEAKESIKKHLSARNAYGHSCSCFMENVMKIKEKVEFT